MNVFPEKPLGLVKEGLEKMGLDISYAYDDLIFPSHTAYLIQFGKENYELNIFLNKYRELENTELLKEALMNVLAGDIGFSLNFSGEFSLVEGEEDELKIQFFPNS